MQTGAPAASTSQVSQRYRAWFEGYGVESHMDPISDFRGDRRETWGGVAGFGVTTAPGVSFGFSVDQGRSKIDITPLSQRAVVDLTQFGANVALGIRRMDARHCRHLRVRRSQFHARPNRHRIDRVV